MRGASNIVFSMCGFDGWGSAGMLSSPDPSRMLVSLNVSDAAHHADLMCECKGSALRPLVPAEARATSNSPPPSIAVSTEYDPPSFAVAREAELGFVAAFIAEARAGAGRREL